MAGRADPRAKMSDKIFDFGCTACAKDNKKVEAVKYCIECSGYCCQQCTDFHKKIPTAENHNFLEVSQARVFQRKQPSGQPSKLPEFPTERCSTHQGKVVDMYCEDHDVVGCYLCFAKDHRSCPERSIHSVPDMIDTLFRLSDCKQTRKCLKDMMDAIVALSKSKETKLYGLNVAKEEAIITVNKFHKALQTILSNLAESSRREVETACEQLEKELRQNKSTIDDVHDELQAMDEKLDVSEANRAEHFVCTKIAQEELKLAEKEKLKQESWDKTAVQLSFVPHQSLMEYLEGLNAIGKVERRPQSGTVMVKKDVKPKHDLYTIKGNGEINIKLSDDSETCYSLGCCLIDDNKLLVTDYINKKLKCIDIQKLSVVDYCALESLPYGVCCINKDEVAIACERDNRIQFVTIREKMMPTRYIKTCHRCYGIAFHDDKIYVSDGSNSVHVYDIHGTVMKTISWDIVGTKMFYDSRHITFRGSGDRMYVGDCFRGVVCCDDAGNYLSRITDSEWKGVDGVCVDGRGNIFVVESVSHNVIQFGENEEKHGVLLNQSNGLYRPRSICFHQGLNRMFVTMNSCSAVKIFDLE